MKFKVGDRVKVYGNTGLELGSWGAFVCGSKGTVVDNYLGADWDSEIRVRMDPDDKISPDERTLDVHPGQCRKLRKKK